MGWVGQVVGCTVGQVVGCIGLVGFGWVVVVYGWFGWVVGYMAGKQMDRESGWA